DGTYYGDRYCPDGTLDLWDYRSENEQRRQDVIDLSLHGKLQTGMLAHALTAGVQRSRVRNRFGLLIYNFADTGNIDGTVVTPPRPEPAVVGNTNRDERSTELYLRDALAITSQWTAWLGVRHTKIDRESALTDGSQATSFSQSFTTPSVALSFEFARDQIV